MLPLCLTIALAGSSALFGERGESWDRERLPDFSYAGYRAGEPLPELAPTVELARPVGDATAHIQRAIDRGGVIRLGPGTWPISWVLQIRRGGVVIQGVGPETVLDVQKSLTEIRGPADRWSWNGGIVEVQGPGPGAVLGAVGPASRGDAQIATGAALEPGQLVLIELTDSDGSFARHLHDDLAEGGTCSWQELPRVWRWPVRIAAVGEGGATLAQPLRTDLREAWQPVLREAPFLAEVGIEHLTVRFPDVPYPGHLDEQGYNGIFVEGGAVDGWIRDVTFVHADNGVLLDSLTKHWTVRGVHLTGRQGHHGYNIADTADVLVEDWVQDADFVHGATVDHRANGTVFRRGSGTALMHLDHHRDAPFANLFTALDAETDFLHGGSWCAGLPSGARTTAWGLAGEILPPYFGTIHANIVGEIEPGYEPLDGMWVEEVEALEPRDLYQAQRDLRLGLLPEEEPDSGAVTGEVAPCGCGHGSLAWTALLVLPWVRRRRAW